MVSTKKTKQKSNYVSKAKANNMRAKLNTLIDEKGVRNGYLAERTNIYPHTITRFRKGEKTITKPTADKLEKLLKEYKF